MSGMTGMQAAQGAVGAIVNDVAYVQAEQGIAIVPQPAAGRAADIDDAAAVRVENEDGIVAAIHDGPELRQVRDLVLELRQVGYRGNIFAWQAVPIRAHADRSPPYSLT
jgi:hypothetical protein